MNRADRRLSTPHIGRKTLDNSRLSGAGRGLNAHRLVAETAVKLAYNVYEAWMGANNDLYRTMRENLTNRRIETIFVAKIAPTLLEEARIALTECLSQPDSEVPVSMKDEIAEALILDNDLRAKRIVAQDRVTAPKGVRLH